MTAMEVRVLRLAHAADLPTLDEALRSLDGAATVQNGAPRPNGTPSGPGNGASAVAQTRMPGGSGGAQTMRLVEATPAPVAFVAPPQPVLEAPPVPLKSLADIVALADAKRDIAFKVLIKSCIRLVRIEPGRIDVGLTSDAPKMLLNELTTKLRAWTGRNWLVSLSKEEGGQTLAEMESTKRENAFLDAKSDPAVAAIVQSKLPQLRNVILHSTQTGFPVAALMTSLCYFEAYRTALLPTNLIQAQRDYFGAHTYQRTDATGSFHTEWGSFEK